MNSNYEESAYKDQLKASLQLAFDTYKNAQKDPNILECMYLYQCRGCRLLTTNPLHVQCNTCDRDIPCYWCCRTEQYATNWVVTDSKNDRRFCSIKCKKQRNKE